MRSVSSCGDNSVGGIASRSHMPTSCGDIRFYAQTPLLWDVQFCEIDWIVPSAPQ